MQLCKKPLRVRQRGLRLPRVGAPHPGDATAEKREFLNNLRQLEPLPEPRCQVVLDEFPPWAGELTQLSARIRQRGQVDGNEVHKFGVGQSSRGCSPLRLLGPE